MTEFWSWANLTSLSLHLSSYSFRVRFSWMMIVRVEALCIKSSELCLVHNQCSKHGACLLVCVCVWSQSCANLCDLMDCISLGSSVAGIFQASILEWVAVSPPEDLPNPGIEPTSPLSLALTGRFFTMSHLGSPQKTW